MRAYALGLCPLFLWHKGVNDMKGTENKKTREHPKKNKDSGKLSDRDLRELMGVYRPTYRRKRGGAFTQR